MNAALAAGVSSDHLGEVSRLLARGPGRKRLEDVPRPSAVAARSQGPLSESEDEEEEVDSGTPSSREARMVKAIGKLTKICSALFDHKTQRSQDPLDKLLDGGIHGLGSEGSGLGSGRRNAAALRTLKRMLLDQPSYIYESIEKNLEQDFMARPSQPGAPLGGGTVRGWLENRSRIQHYVGHIRWSWAVVGIWDALIANKPSEARARCALLLAAADQSSIDGGSWLLANVCMLENLPPYHAFVNHQHPTSQELQQPW